MWGGGRLCKKKGLEYIRSCRASIKISCYIPRSSLHAFSPNVIDFFLLGDLGSLTICTSRKKNSRLLVGTHVMVQTLPVLVISFKTAYKKKKLYSCYITIQRVRGWAERVNTNIWDQSKNNFSEINLIFFFLTDELRFSFIDVTFIVANRIIRQNVT